MDQEYKEYKYKEKKVKIRGFTYKAVFPEKHSRIEGLVYESRDANAGDDYANITDYQAVCFIRWNGSKRWENVYKGPSGCFKVGNTELGGGGIYPILFALESEEVREKYLKQKKIAALKKEIKANQKELEELVK